MNCKRIIWQKSNKILQPQMRKQVSSVAERKRVDHSGHRTCVWIRREVASWAHSDSSRLLAHMMFCRQMATKGSAHVSSFGFDTDRRTSAWVQAKMADVWSSSGKHRRRRIRTISKIQVAFISRWMNVFNTNCLNLEPYEFTQC